MLPSARKQKWVKVLSALAQIRDRLSGGGFRCSSLRQGRCPMSIATQKLITAEEFARMPNPPDGSQQELVRGVIITMPPPGGLHGFCCSKIARKVGNFVDEHHLGTTTSNDTGFILGRNPDTVRGPDILFWSKEFLPVVPKGYIGVPPDLAVEVVSPDDHFARLNRKLVEYTARRIRLVWIVDPEDPLILAARERHRQGTGIEVCWRWRCVY